MQYFFVEEGRRRVTVFNNNVLCSFQNSKHVFFDNNGNIQKLLPHCTQIYVIYQENQDTVLKTIFIMFLCFMLYYVVLISFPAGTAKKQKILDSATSLEHKQSIARKCCIKIQMLNNFKNDFFYFFYLLGFLRNLKF